MFKCREKLYLSAVFIFFIFFAVQLFADPVTHYAYFDSITNSDGSDPLVEDIQFTAYITTRPGEILTQDSPNCGYELLELMVVMGDPDTHAGRIYIDCGQFTTAWSPGDILHLNVQNITNGESGVLEGTLTSAGEDWFIDDYALPVELAFLAASPAGEVINIKWSTLSETDNLGFNVYRSYDYENNFEQINNKIIPGAGTSTQKNEYTFTDITFERTNIVYYKLENVDISGTKTTYGPIAVTLNTTTNSAETFPDKYVLLQNFPNPFNPVTTIKYALPEAAEVRLAIYNIQGSLVYELANRYHEAGTYAVTWSGEDQNGVQSPTGLYFARLICNNFSGTIKMYFIK